MSETHVLFGWQSNVLWQELVKAPQASVEWLSSKVVLAGAKQQTIRDECTEGCSIRCGGFNLQPGLLHVLLQDPPEPQQDQNAEDCKRTSCLIEAGGSGGGVPESR